VTLLSQHSTASAPSRHDNPFATCWTRPGAIAFRFDDGQSAEQLLAQLARQGWWGAIVGPHGSGKSTLLEALQPALRDMGRCVHFAALRGGQRRVPRGSLALVGGGETLVVVDGYEQLSMMERWRLKRRCRRAKVGLLVTSHGETNVPTLIRLAPDLRLVQRLVTDLAARMSTPVTGADVAASHACHGSNVREVFFDLYDRHERLRRAGRTHAVAGA
jgi:hypothetical protein